jgi:hypothetical protein
LVFKVWCEVLKDKIQTNVNSYIQEPTPLA